MVVCDDLAVLTRPGADERRAEVAGVEDGGRGARARGRADRGARARSTAATCCRSGDASTSARGGRTNAEGIRQLRAHPRAARRARSSPCRLQGAAPEVGGDRAARRHVPRLPAESSTTRRPSRASSRCPRRRARTSSCSAAARCSWPRRRPRSGRAVRATSASTPVAVDIGEFEKLEGCVTCLSVLCWPGQLLEQRELEPARRCESRVERVPGRACRLGDHLCARRPRRPASPPSSRRPRTPRGCGRRPARRPRLERRLHLHRARPASRIVSRPPFTRSPLTKPEHVAAEGSSSSSWSRRAGAP